MKELDNKTFDVCCHFAYLKNIILNLFASYTIFGSLLCQERQDENLFLSGMGHFLSRRVNAAEMIVPILAKYLYTQRVINAELNTSILSIDVVDSPGRQVH
jgi:hypothetical protein